jgi:hypothetical protein
VLLAETQKRLASNKISNGIVGKRLRPPFLRIVTLLSPGAAEATLIFFAGGFPDF